MDILFIIFLLWLGGKTIGAVMHPNDFHDRC